jgi:hypothetical protein
MTNKKEQAKATAEPPFDLAQGRLFRDDNQRTNDKDNCNSRSPSGMTTRKATTTATAGGSTPG